MCDIPEDVIHTAEKHVPDMYRKGGFDHRSVSQAIVRAILAERERSRQLLSEAEKREREARAKALEEAAQVADDMPKFLVKSPVHVEITSPKDVAERIRSLQSEER